jgi:hypothetical protein
MDNHPPGGFHFSLAAPYAGRQPLGQQRRRLPELS